MEGVVTKQASAKYTPEATTWVKIKNQQYSQVVGRDDLLRAIIVIRKALIMTGAAGEALGTLWRERLENARNRYEAAKAAVQDARELESQIPSADGNFALAHAVKAERYAVAEFKRVLIFQ